MQQQECAGPGCEPPQGQWSRWPEGAGSRVERGGSSSNSKTQQTEPSGSFLRGDQSTQLALLYMLCGLQGLNLLQCMRKHWTNFIWQFVSQVTYAAKGGGCFLGCQPCCTKIIRMTHAILLVDSCQHNLWVSCGDACSNAMVQCMRHTHTHKFPIRVQHPKVCWPDTCRSALPVKERHTRPVTQAQAL